MKKLRRIGQLPASIGEEEEGHESPNSSWGRGKRVFLSSCKKKNAQRSRTKKRGKKTSCTEKKWGGGCRDISSILRVSPEERKM